MEKIPKRNQHDDGPTSFFTVDENVFLKAQQAMYAYVAQYGNHVTANEKSPNDVEAYLLEKYDCVPYPLLGGKLGCLVLNVIGNHYKEVYDRYEFSSDIMGDAEHWITELGLQPRAYLITKTEKSKLLYENQKLEFESHNLSNAPQDIVVEMELTTGWGCVNASELLADELWLYRGISQDIIDEKSERLYGYLKLLEKYNQL